MELRSLSLKVWISAFFLIIFMLAGSTAGDASAENENRVFAQQSGTPIGIKNFIVPEDECNWMGVGGQVFDQPGNSLTGLVVKVEGIIDGQQILVYSITGGTMQLGPGGYLIKLANRPINSTESMSLQVLDIGGNAISPRLGFPTYGDCSRNLILLNVHEMNINHPQFLPLIRR